MKSKKSEVLQGTLDLMILKTLHALGPLHGFGIARRIEQVSRDVLQLNEGTVYTSLLRLQQQAWIAAEWGTSENNRKAKFYSITKRGEKHLQVEAGVHDFKVKPVPVWRPSNPRIFRYGDSNGGR